MKRALILPVIALVVGCPARDKPLVVAAPHLARFYLDDPRTAARAYDGQPIHIALTNPVRSGYELHWHISSPKSPALIVCEFEGEPPPIRSVIWLVGTCRGKVVDGQSREFPGYDFHVLITGCRAAEPPTTPGH
jgi:hypothetical protein